MLFSELRYGVKKKMLILPLKLGRLRKADAKRVLW